MSYIPLITLVKEINSVDYEQLLIKRLAELRQKQGVSARDMSLSMNQNVNYINSIEHGKITPSMKAFFGICEFLNITPQDFFDTENSQPERLAALIETLKNLDDDALNLIAGVAQKMLGGAAK
jgi:transcriptional regulator with XRE-family HTH domain